MKRRKELLLLGDSRDGPETYDRFDPRIADEILRSSERKFLDHRQTSNNDKAEGNDALSRFTLVVSNKYYALSFSSIVRLVRSKRYLEQEVGHGGSCTRSIATRRRSFATTATSGRNSCSMFSGRNRDRKSRNDRGSNGSED